MFQENIVNLSERGNKFGLKKKKMSCYKQKNHTEYFLNFFKEMFIYSLKYVLFLHKFLYAMYIDYLIYIC